MEYEKPELAELSSAITAIQTAKQSGNPENPKDASPSYEDWE
jgi:hypothetical protein